MNWRWMPLCSLGLLLALIARSLADGVIRDGLGARSAGRGGTNIAFADNGVVLFDNPAGMVNIDGCGLADAGFDVLFTNLHYSEQPNINVGADDDPVPLAQAAIIRRGPNPRWAYGLGLFAPAGFATEYDMAGPFPLVGVRRYKSFGSMAKILPGVACRLTDRLSVGGTLGVGVSHMEVEGPYFLQSPGAFQGTPTMLDLQSTGAALAWSAGVQYQLTPATTLGATYQGETRFEMDGNARVEVPLMGQTGFDLDMAVTWPRTIGVGIRHELCPHRILSADVIWFDWSTAFDGFDLRLSEATNPVFADVIGPSLRERFPLDWRDTISARMGYQQHLGGGRVIRFGYVYHRNQIPAQTLTPYIPTILEHTFSFGYGQILAGWHVDLAYQFMFGRDRTVASSGLVGGDFDGGRVESQAHFLYLSFLRRF
jgi:long-chain fatty acid transport protein